MKHAGFMKFSTNSWLTPQMKMRNKSGVLQPYRSETSSVLLWTKSVPSSQYLAFVDAGVGWQLRASAHQYWEAKCREREPW